MNSPNFCHSFTLPLREHTTPHPSSSATNRFPKAPDHCEGRLCGKARPRTMTSSKEKFGSSIFVRDRSRCDYLLYVKDFGDDARWSRVVIVVGCSACGAEIGLWRGSVLEDNKEREVGGVWTGVERTWFVDCWERTPSFVVDEVCGEVIFVHTQLIRLIFHKDLMHGNRETNEVEEHFSIELRVLSFGTPVLIFELPLEVAYVIVIDANCSGFSKSNMTTNPRSTVAVHINTRRDPFEQTKYH